LQCMIHVITASAKHAAAGKPAGSSTFHAPRSCPVTLFSGKLFFSTLPVFVSRHRYSIFRKRTQRDASPRAFAVDSGGRYQYVIVSGSIFGSSRSASQRKALCSILSFFSYSRSFKRIATTPAIVRTVKTNPTPPAAVPNFFPNFFPSPLAISLGLGFILKCLPLE